MAEGKETGRVSKWAVRFNCESQSTQKSENRNKKLFANLVDSPHSTGITSNLMLGKESRNIKIEPFLFMIINDHS